MGCDCYNYLPVATKRNNVEEFLIVLGYEKGRRLLINSRNITPFYFYKDEDYKYVEGVYAEVWSLPEGGVVVKMHTTIWRSKNDSDFHNHTIRQLKKYYGGYFESDYGKNRYLQYDNPIKVKAESGCDIAFSSFHYNLKRTKWFIQNAIKEDRVIFEFDFIKDHNPNIIGSNLVIPFLVSIIEEYFRSTYIALLKYSSRKEKILNNIRVSPSEMITMLSEDNSIEQVFASGRSFQNMKKVCKNFKELDSKIDIFGILQKPYRRRKETIYSTL